MATAAPPYETGNGRQPLAVSQYIAGEWTDARAEEVRHNPARPAEVVSRAPVANAEEAAAAVDAARAAGKGWRHTPGAGRGAILRRAAELVAGARDELADLMVREAGKVTGDARGEVHRAVDTLHYHAARAWAAPGGVYESSDPDEEVRTARAPVGVVAAITPWNFPLAIPAWKLAPALVHGNAVVWKSAPETPAVSAAFMRLLAEAGLPPGVCNLVLGDAEAGRRLVADAGVDAVTFTGSVPAGREVAATAGARGARVQSECGGHNPALVFADANLDLAAHQVVQGAMLAAGQKCTATRRVIAAPEVHDVLVERIVERATALRVGDPAREDTDVGPLISGEARTRVLDAVEAARDSGAVLLAGGHALDDAALEGGHYVAPTVLAVKDPDAVALCREEVFGPVTAIMTAGDDDEMIALANATDYGLSAAVFTADERRRRRAIAEVEAGVIHVNGPTTGAAVHAPFGGEKASGSPEWREQGEAAREFFTTSRTVYVLPGH